MVELRRPRRDLRRMLCARAGKGDCSSLPTAVQLSALWDFSCELCWDLSSVPGHSCATVGISVASCVAVEVALTRGALRVALPSKWRSRADRLVYLCCSFKIFSCQGGSHAYRRFLSSVHSCVRVSIHTIYSHTVGVPVFQSRTCEHKYHILSHRGLFIVVYKFSIIDTQCLERI